MILETSPLSTSSFIASFLCKCSETGLLLTYQVCSYTNILTFLLICYIVCYCGIWTVYMPSQSYLVAHHPSLKNTGISIFGISKIEMAGW